MLSRARSKVAPLAIAAAFAVTACADSDDTTTTVSAAQGATTTLTATTPSSTTSGATDTTAPAPTTSEGDAATTLPSIEDLQAALEDGDLSTIAQAIDVIGVERLIGSKEFTLLAPNDEAFRSLTPAQLADLLAKPTELTDLLKNHLITEELSADDLQAMSSVETAAGISLLVEVDGDTLTIGGAKVLAADRDAGPGVIHVIDTVLLIES